MVKSRKLLAFIDGGGRKRKIRIEKNLKKYENVKRTPYFLGLPGEHVS